VRAIQLIRPSVIEDTFFFRFVFTSHTPPPHSAHRQLDLPFSQVPHDHCFLLLPLPSGILQHFLSLLHGNLLLSSGYFTRLTVCCWTAFLLLPWLETINSNQTSKETHCVRYSLPDPQANWVTKTVSLTVPYKYSTGITML